MIRTLGSMLYNPCKLLTTAIFDYFHMQWLQLHGAYRKDSSRTQTEFISDDFNILKRQKAMMSVPSYYLKHQAFPTDSGRRESPNASNFNVIVASVKFI